MSDAADTAAERINGAIRDALTDRAEIVTKWTAVVEVIGEDGERACYAVSAPECSSWDSVGLLTFALHDQAARHMPGYEP